MKVKDILDLINNETRYNKKLEFDFNHSFLSS